AYPLLPLHSLLLSSTLDLLKRDRSQSYYETTPNRLVVRYGMKSEEFASETPVPGWCKISASGISGPSLTGGQDLARRRYQRGALRREGQNWILRWREDVLNESGAGARVERRGAVGA